jgi:hypothetical protein
MKVLNLRCAAGHSFEGWFASEDDYQSQQGRGLVTCPLCADTAISRLPSAPRLNLSGAKAPTAPTAPTAPKATAVAAPTANSQTALTTDSSKADATEVMPADVQAAWLRTVRHLIDNTEDVGSRFAEAARRIHYGEEPARGIRGQVSPQERVALREEGIETLSVPIPDALKGPVQ